MKVRVCFSKTEAGRYLSHLDMTRTMERSLRRAKLPLAFSQGYHPHLKMSFASALAVGVTGRREYLDLELAEQVSMQRFSQVLADALPPALHFVSAQEIRNGAKSLSAMVNLSVVRFYGEMVEGDVEKIRYGIQQVLGEKEIWQKPKTKPGKKAAEAKEVRALIRRIRIVEAEEAGEALDNNDASLWNDDAYTGLITVEAELVLGNKGQLRPQDLWAMILRAGGLDTERPIQISRWALLIEREGKVFPPMDED